MSANSIANYLIVVVAKSSLLFLGATLITVAMRRRGAAARHLVWIGAIVGAALLPVVGALLPVWNVPVLSTARHTARVTPHPSGDDLRAAQNPASVSSPAMPNGTALSATTSGESAVATLAPDVSRATTFQPPSLHVDGVLVLLVVWGTGTALFLFQMVLSVLSLTRLQRRATSVADPTWDRALQSVQRGDRPITLLVSDDVEVPLTWGIFSSVILLPREADEWSRARRELVLRHELAHIARHDVSSQLLARVVRAVYWPNPLAWLAERNVRRECEQACDDAVIAAGVRPTRYAEELLAIVSELSPRGLASLAPGLASRPSLELRLHALLDARAQRRRATRLDAALTVVGVLSLALPLAAMMPVARSVERGALSVRQDKSRVQRGAALSVAREAGRVERGALGVSRPAMPPAIRLVAEPSVPRPQMAVAPPPTPAENQICPVEGGSHSNSMQEHQGLKSWEVHWSGRDCAVDLRAEGDIKFNDDLTDIASISRTGFFDLSVREGDALTRLVVRPAGQGELDRRFTVNGAERRWDAGAREWFADFLLALDRQTGFGIDVRFPTLLAHGVPAVFDEIETLGDDYVRGLYFQRLIERAKLTPSQVRETLQLAGRDMHNDYELARILIAVSDRYGLPDEDTRAAFLNAVNSLSNDYERNRALITLLSRSELSPREASQVLQSASALSSDYELARTLVLMIDKKLISSALHPLFLDDAAKLSNDYERARVIVALLGSGKLTNAEVARVIGLTGGINNDYERARVLVAVADGYDLGDEARDSYMKAARSISNDYERGRAMAALKGR
jgi:beta-lactamase regulating signal transducer with metallopeptidase domain